MVEENYENACRLCLNCNSRNVNLFQNDSYAHIISIITTCLPIKVTKDDALPTLICSVCMEKVQSWDSFQKLCKESQEILQNWLQKKQDKQRQESVATVSSETEAQTMIDVMNMSIHVKEEIPDDVIDDNSDFEFETYTPDLSFKLETEDIKKGVKEANISYTNTDISTNEKVDYNHEDLVRMIVDKTCRYCSKAIPSNTHLIFHLRKVHFINIPFNMCLHCKSILPNQKLAKSHRWNCKKKCMKEPCFMCQNISENSPSTNNKYNNESAETSDYKFSCAICGKLFKTMNEWSEHRTVHDAITTESLLNQFVIDKYTCSTCSEIFITKAELEKHENSHYVDIEPTEKESDSPHLACNFLNEGSFTNPDGITTQKFEPSSKQLKESLKRQSNSKQNQNKSKGDRKYKCPDCSKIFTDVPSYASHRGHHTRERRINAENSENSTTYACKGCHQKFPFVTKYRRHMKVCSKLSRPTVTTSKWSYKFPTINFKNTNSKKFKLVQKSANKSISLDGGYRCVYPKCGKNFLSSSRKYKHQLICDHRPRDFNSYRKIHPNAIQCKDCRGMYISPISFGKHKKRGNCKKVENRFNEKDINIGIAKTEEPTVGQNKGNISNPLTCDKCHQTMKTMCGLVSHRKYCHFRATSRCLKCNEVLDSTAALTLHFKTKHQQQPGTFLQACKICKKEIYTLKGYRYHMLKHKSIQNPNASVQCNECKKYFASKGSLRKHKTFNCPVLKEKKANSMNDMVIVQTKPMRVASTENKNLTPSMSINCAVCSDTFETISDLREHILIKHTPNIITERKKKTFFCQFCKMAFNRHLDLQQHFTNYHANNFQTDYPLPPVLVPAVPTYHMKSNITCSTCQLSFDDINELESHISAFHSFN